MKGLLLFVMVTPADTQDAVAAGSWTLGTAG
jgi:hypothetical protein